VFHCDQCDALVFFESVTCLSCGHALAYFPGAEQVRSLDQAGPDRPCENYAKHAVCNWAVPADDPNPLCRSCRLTRVIPNLAQASNKLAWFRLESAKRRLVYSLLHLGCPVESKAEQPQRGLAFEFLADLPAAPKVTTGHAGGVITVNIAEADDAEREKRRVQLHEPYRTLLGHLRHEVGHYYWDRLVKDAPRLERFRELFGDERADYAQALQAHYHGGAPPDWQERFVSAYAASHPWEDWAETWAHYLHSTDTLEIAAACGLTLRPARADEPSLKKITVPQGEGREPFDRIAADWHALTYVLNNLNRSLGQADAYPFVLSPPALDKLRFVHDTIAAA
jgi:hypothetical protein